MLKKISLGLILASLVSTSALADGAHKHESKDKEFVLKARAGWLHSQHTFSLGSVEDLKSNYNSYTGEIALDYFFTRNIALEGSVGYGKVSSDGDEKSTIIPVSALIQYHFMPESTISPYIGAGYSYQFIGKSTDALLKGAGGAVGQLGLDIPYSDLIGFNIDVKYTYKAPHKFTDDLTQKKTDKISTTAVTAGVSFTF
jgi:outer membrane protein